MSLPVYVMKSAASAAGYAGDDVKVWLDVCHSKHNFLFIAHDRMRYTSRHAVAENKRPFIVNCKMHKRVGYYKVGSSATLEGAMKIAKRESKSVEAK
jgi:hypothetical protein